MKTVMFTRAGSFDFTEFSVIPSLLTLTKAAYKYNSSFNRPIGRAGEFSKSRVVEMQYNRLSY